MYLDGLNKRFSAVIMSVLNFEIKPNVFIASSDGFAFRQMRVEDRTALTVVWNMLKHVS